MASGVLGSLTCLLWFPVPSCRSKHEEIDLVSVEEFYQEAPPEISKDEVTRNDPHQQTLCRLDWELEQRKRWVGSLGRLPPKASPPGKGLPVQSSW